MIECEICGGDANYMGLLGNLKWYRCEDCGGEFSVRYDEFDDETFDIFDDEFEFYPLTDDE